MGPSIRRQCDKILYRQKRKNRNPGFGGSADISAAFLCGPQARTPSGTFIVPRT